MPRHVSLDDVDVVLRSCFRFRPQHAPGSSSTRSPNDFLKREAVCSTTSPDIIATSRMDASAAFMSFDEPATSSSSLLKFLALLPCTSQSRVERPPASRFAAVAARLRSVWRRILMTFVGFKGATSSSSDVCARISSLVGASGDAGSSFVSVERSRRRPWSLLASWPRAASSLLAAASFGPLSLVASLALAALVAGLLCV